MIKSICFYLYHCFDAAISLFFIRIFYPDGLCLREVSNMVSSLEGGQHRRFWLLPHGGCYAAIAQC